MKLLSILAAFAPLVGASGAAEPPVSFTNDVAPILVQKCLTCHGPEKSKGGYRLHTYEALLAPGTSKERPVAPGDPQASQLFRLITATDEDDRMPQKNDPLPSADMARIKTWIEQGAKFDGPDPKAALVAIIPPIPQPDPPDAYPGAAPITALAFSPDGGELAVSGYHEITLWNPVDGQLLRRIKNVAQRTLALAWQPHGSLLAAASGTPGKMGEVKLFDARSGRLVRTLVTSADAMLAVAFSPDGAKLAAGGSDNAIRIFDAAAGKTERIIEQHADWLTALAFSHDGTLLASASRDKSARLFDVKTGAMEHSYLGHGDFVNGVAFSADDKRVFTGGRDRKVHLWSAEEAKKDSKKDKAVELTDFDGEVLKLIVTSNALFTCSTDRGVRQHSLDKKPALLRTFAHDDVVFALAFDESSRRLATGGFDGRVRVWAVDRGELLLTFIAAPGFVAADGKPSR